MVGKNREAAKLRAKECCKS